jgi:large subunit ribosomal protein L29
MKAEKLRESEDDELVSKRTELRKQIFQMRIQKAIGQLDRPTKIRELRKDMARIETILGERKKKASEA